MFNEREFERFTREMNRMTESFMRDMDRMVQGFEPIPNNNKNYPDNVFSFKEMKTEKMESEDEYTYNIELPGCKKENISINLENNMLIVNAEKNKENKEEDNEKNVVFSEFFEGKISRAFPIDKNITEEDIKAKYENGILSITIPKKKDKIETTSRIMIE